MIFAIPVIPFLNQHMDKISELFFRMSFGMEKFFVPLSLFLHSCRKMVVY